MYPRRHSSPDREEEDDERNLGKYQDKILGKRETETTDEFTDKLNAMTSKLSTLGVALEDSYLVKKLLDTILDKYFYVVTRIEQFHDLETMPFEEAIGRMKAYEERTTRLSRNANNIEG
ncbi:hypothetical protein V6N13_009256 [Hibiscus sabdariffa]